MGSSRAYAQEPEPPQSAQDGSALTDIVVTAQRREQRLVDVPISITALTDEQLIQRGTRSVRDLQFSVPNLTLYSRTDFNPNFIIRGIATGARNVGFESGLGVYVDGVFQGRTSASTQELDDIERVEVLRGPQGTLFGKNTTAGALNLVTHRPGDALEGRVLAEYGNFDYQRLSGYVSGPLASDKLYAKVSAFGTRRDGYARNTFSGGPDRLDGDGSYGFRGELRFTPVEALDISLRGDWSQVDRRQYDAEVGAVLDNPFEISLANPVPGPRTLATDGENRERRTIKGTSLTATLGFGAGYQLTSISALRELSYRTSGGDLDFEPADFLGSSSNDRLRQFTQEVRISSPATDRFNYVAGIFYFDQRSRTSRAILPGDDLKSLLEAALDIPPSALPPLRTFGDVRTRSFAGFLNANFRLTAQIELAAGGRYSDERKTLNFGQDGIPLLGFPVVPPGRDRARDDDFSPTIGINIRPRPDTLLYARYAKGFKSGGWNADLLSSPSLADIRFRPESIENYEVGFKADLLARRVRLNVAAFNLVYKDIQVSRYNDATAQFQTTNAAKARSRGFEVELLARPANGLELGGALGHADAVYRSYANASPGIDLSGSRLDAPQWTASASAEYTRSIGGTLAMMVRGDYAYRDETAGDGIDTRSALPGFGTVDARIGVRSTAGWQVSVFGRNLTNKNYLTERYVGGNLVGTLGIVQLIESYGRPRTYGVTADLRF